MVYLGPSKTEIWHVSQQWQLRLSRTALNAGSSVVESLGASTSRRPVTTILGTLVEQLDPCRSAALASGKPNREKEILTQWVRFWRLACPGTHQASDIAGIRQCHFSLLEGWLHADILVMAFQAKGQGCKGISRVLLTLKDSPSPRYGQQAAPSLSRLRWSLLRRLLLAGATPWGKTCFNYELWV